MLPHTVPCGSQQRRTAHGYVGRHDAVADVLTENVSGNKSAGEIRVRASFPPELTRPYFRHTASNVSKVKSFLPELFSDFQEIGGEPRTVMATVDIRVP